MHRPYRRAGHAEDRLRRSGPAAACSVALDCVLRREPYGEAALRCRAWSAGVRQAGVMEPHVVVEPEAGDGGRRVRAGAEILGVAYGPRDLLEFLRRAGAVDDVDQVDLAAADWIEWHGGGPDAWT